MTSTGVGVQRRILSVLAAAQVLGGVGVAAAIAVSSLVATRMSGSEAVGGLAQTCAVIGTAIAAFVVARVAVRAGRRPALSLGYGVATLGAAGAVVAVTLGSAPALLLSLILLGAASAAGLSARFAATDLAPPDRRARALSLVVWATTVGAVAGPNLAAPVQALAGSLGLVPASGPFLLCTGVFALAALGTWAGLRPDPLLIARAADRTDTGDPPSTAEARAALLASPPALLGLGGIVVGHVLMIALMSMTPVHMDHGGATLAVVGLVISLHVVGMYAFSPVLGWLADRAGRTRVLMLGAVILLVSGVLGALAGPHDTVLLAVALTLLGLGWSGCLVAGSALLSESVPARVRTGVQGLSDVAMNVSGAIGGIAAGLVFAGASYAALGVVAAVLAAAYLVAAGSTLRAKPREALP